MYFDNDPDLRCIQVVSEGVDKKLGVEKLRELAKLNDVPVLAIGDGGNDIALFKAMRPGFDLTVAVRNKNTPEELLDLADVHVRSVEEDGFVEAVTKYVLPV